MANEDVYWACHHGNLELLEKLVASASSSVIVDTPISNSLTPMLAAVNGGHDLVVKRLIELGSDVNLSQKPGKISPLHAACKQGRLGIVRILVAAGADITAKDSRGSTPADTATEAQHNEVLKIINEQQIRALLENEDGIVSTPLTNKFEGQALRRELTSIVSRVEKIEVACSESAIAGLVEKMRSVETRLDILEQDLREVAKTGYLQAQLSAALSKIDSLETVVNQLKQSQVQTGGPVHPHSKSKISHSQGNSWSQTRGRKHPSTPVRRLSGVEVVLSDLE